MFHILRQRLHDSIHEVNETLVMMALDARLMPAITPEGRTVRSSASTPSLRSRDGTIPMHARMDAGGNVKVVVRVRAFLRRGKEYSVFKTNKRRETDKYYQQSLSDKQDV